MRIIKVGNLSATEITILVISEGSSSFGSSPYDSAYGTSPTAMIAKEMSSLSKVCFDGSFSYITCVSSLADSLIASNMVVPEKI